MNLDEAIKRWEDRTRDSETELEYAENAEIADWLKELRTLRTARALPGFRCAGCGSPVVKKGDACHSCKDGTHDPEDARWLNQEEIKKIREAMEDSKRRTHGFVTSVRNK